MAMADDRVSIIQSLNRELGLNIPSSASWKEIKLAIDNLHGRKSVKKIVDEGDEDESGEGGLEHHAEGTDRNFGYADHSNTMKQTAGKLSHVRRQGGIPRISPRRVKEVVREQLTNAGEL